MFHTLIVTKPTLPFFVLDLDLKTDRLVTFSLLCIQAFWESERLAEEKARVKREERVIKQWTRLIQGLRIRQRLQEQYGRKTDQMHEDKTTHKVKPSMLKEDKGSSADQGDLQTEAEMNARAQIETEKVRTLMIY